LGPPPLDGDAVTAAECTRAVVPPLATVDTLVHVL
jgi:hypothetical protein